MIAASSTLAAPPRVLEVRGLWYDMYGVDRAVARAGGAVMTQTWPASKTIKWYSPASPADLSRYGLVVIDGIEGESLSDTASLTDAALKDYVSKGGSVLLLGGFYGFGPEHHGSPLEEIAPVTFGATNDREQGVFAVAPGPAAPAYSFAQKPLVLWLHDVAAKPDARIVLTAGGKPLLVEGEYGKGRVAVFAGTVMGDPGAGQDPFWTWDEWPKVLGDTVAWLAASHSTAATSVASTLSDALGQSGGKPELELAALMRASDSCRDSATANSILDTLIKLSWNLTLPDADRIDERLHSFVDPSSADVATRLTQSDDAGRISLGLRLLGQARPPGTLNKLSSALTSGDVDSGASTGDDLTPDVGVATDPEDRANAIRLGAVIGLGRLGDPSALDAIQTAKAAALKIASPPGSYPIAPTYGDQIARQADIAALRCGDLSAAQGAIDAVLATRTTLATTMIEMSIPLVGKGPHDMEILRRLNAKRAYASAYAAKADADMSLIGLPDGVLPAVAKALANSDDPWVVPLAYTVFGRSFRPTLPPEVAATLKTAKLPAIADLAARSL